LVADEIKQVIGPDRTVTAVTLDKTVLLPPRTETGVLLIDALANANSPSMPDLLRRAVSPNGPSADLWLVVLPSTAPDLIGSTNQALTGIGSYHHDLPFTTTHETPYLAASIVAIDGKTFEEIAIRPLLFSGTDSGFPVKILADSTKHDRWSQLSEPEKGAIHQAIVELVRSAIRTTLAASGLAPHG
jgi:hypothetical protein